MTHRPAAGAALDPEAPAVRRATAATGTPDDRRAGVAPGMVASPGAPPAGTTVYALATGAGKDATLALHRARAAGLHVPVAFNLYDGETDRVAFHGTRVELVRAHCEALGLEPVLAPTEPGAFEPAFREMLERLVAMGVGGVVFGNIHLGDVRAWYEKRTAAAGLLHREPLWGEAPADLVREVVDTGYRAVVVSVDLERGDPDWVGLPLDLDLVARVEARGADPCGEHGEFHTFVHDGPGFRRPVPVERGEVVEMRGHRLVDLLPVRDARPGAGPEGEGGAPRST